MKNKIFPILVIALPMFGMGCDHTYTTVEPYTWSWEGKPDEQLYDCKPIVEPRDDKFTNNFLCLKKGGPAGAAFEWSASGTIEGMRCTQVYEGAEPPDNSHDWDDNYICVHQGDTGLNSSIYFTWSEAGEIAGKKCLQWYEPNHEDATWSDNYLCWEP